MPYITITDVYNLGVPQQALQSVTVAQQNAELQAASDVADGYFRARWGTNAVPLVAWDTSVTQAVAQIAAYKLCRIRGYRGNAGSDTELRIGYEDAIKWLGQVQHQQAHPKVTLAQTGAPGTPQPNLTSTSVVNVMTGATGKNRGW